VGINPFLPFCAVASVWGKYFNPLPFYLEAIQRLFPVPFQSATEYVIMRFVRLFTRLPLRGIIHLVSRQGNFTDYFVGFEKNRAVQGIFGAETEQVLKNLKIDFIWFGYMGVSDDDGHLMVNKQYLATGSRQDIYLDVVHELCHVKQHMEGRDLFDPRYDYVDRPTEIEAYRYAVLEAKRIGLSTSDIRVYLKTEMMSTKALDKLIANMGVDLE
jgi:hypothetical protein